MIASIYKDTGEALIRVANAVIDGNNQAMFCADADWEITHFGVMETVGGPSLLQPLPGAHTIMKGSFLTLDLKETRFEFRKAETENVSRCDNILEAEIVV